MGDNKHECVRKVNEKSRNRIMELFAAPGLSAKWGTKPSNEFKYGSELHLHHAWCNFAMLPREGCKQCERLLERFPEDCSPDEMAAKYFPNAVKHS